MKKSSKSLSLVLMGTLTVGLGGCASDEKITEEFKAYSSIDECVKEQIFAPEECRNMAIAAVRQNPQFTDQNECERQFGEGNCQTVSGANEQGERRSSWMPILAGYMIGRYMGGSGAMQGAQPLYQTNQPQQQGRASGGFNRSFRTMGGETVQTDARGKVTNSTASMRQGFATSAKPVMSRAGSGTRGGFFGGAASS